MIGKITNYSSCHYFVWVLDYIYTTPCQSGLAVSISLWCTCRILSLSMPGGFSCGCTGWYKYYCSIMNLTHPGHPHFLHSLSDSLHFSIFILSARSILRALSALKKPLIALIHLQHWGHCNTFFIHWPGQMWYNWPSKKVYKNHLLKKKKGSGTSCTQSITQLRLTQSVIIF